MTRDISLRLFVLLLIAASASGCQLVEGIFKAGMWVGILMVLVVVGLLFMLVGRRGA
jgi:hypothetical protein